MRKQQLIVLGSILVLAVQTSRANVTFTPGNHPQPDEENILLNSGGEGSTVFGTVGHSSLQVAFSSATDTLLEPSSGQARIEASDGSSINNITISVPGGAFIDLILNPFNGTGDATLTALINEPGGGTSTSTFTYPDGLGNGQNFVTIVASAGETLASLTINSPEGFTDLRQPRISGAHLTNVPDMGSSVIYLGMSMVALSVVGRGWTRKLHSAASR